MRRPGQPAMLFDGECGFCRHWVGKWRRITGDSIDYFSYQDALDDFPEVTQERCEEAVQLILPDGEVYSAARAVFKALTLAGRYRSLLLLYERMPFFAWASETVYRLVSRHRDMLARWTLK